MEYSVTLANNLVHLLPDLPRKTSLNSTSALTIEEIATKIGVPSLLLVGGIIDNALLQPDSKVEDDAEIVLLGPIAGG